MRTLRVYAGSLVLQDITGEYMLHVVGSNQGDPYRETLRITFEKTGSWESGPPPERIAGVELEPHEEEELRRLLVKRHEHAARVVPQEPVRPAAKDALWALLERHRARLMEPSAGTVDGIEGNPCGFRFGDNGHMAITITNRDARALLRGETEPVTASTPPPPLSLARSALELADSVTILASELRQMIAYARWQMEDGKDYHPTLPSAVASAEAALTKRGLDFKTVQSDLLQRIKPT